MDKIFKRQTMIKVIIFTLAVILSLLIAFCLYRSGIVYDEWGNGSGPTPLFAGKGLWAAGFICVVFGLGTLCCIPFNLKKAVVNIHFIVAICIIIFSLTAVVTSTIWLNQIIEESEVMRIGDYTSNNHSNTFIFLIPS